MHFYAAMMRQDKHRSERLVAERSSSLGSPLNKTKVFTFWSITESQIYKVDLLAARVLPPKPTLPTSQSLSSAGDSQPLAQLWRGLRGPQSPRKVKNPQTDQENK